MSKKFIVNVGCARSGTTAMDAFFEKNRFVETPREKKEIQAFSKDNIKISDYLKYFDDIDSDFFFESSPPYVHAGLSKFERVLKHIKSCNDDSSFLIVFNLRSLAKRAFSHYWHDISKHHALYGADWRVRTKTDPNRYSVLYTDNFFEALTKDYNKFLPDIMQMILLSGKELGWKNVKVILQKELNRGVERLCDEIGVNTLGEVVPRTLGCKAPVILEPGSYKVMRNGQYDKVEVGTNLAARIGYDGVEFLDKKRYETESIIESCKNWSRSVKYSDVAGIFDRYYAEQARNVRLIPKDVFLTDLNIESELFKIEDISVENESLVEKLN